MAVAIEQDANLFGTSGSTTVTSPSFTPTDGNVLFVLALGHDNSVTGLTISDTFGESWTWNERIAFGQNANFGPDLHYRAWTVEVTGTPGSGTISVNGGVVVNGWDLIILELSGVDTTTADGVADVDSVRTGSGVTSVTGALTGTSGNAVVGVCCLETTAPAAGFTATSPLVDYESGGDNAPDHDTLVAFSSTEDATPGFSWTPTPDYTAFFLEFTTAVAGGDPEGPLVGGKLARHGILQGRLVR